MKSEGRALSILGPGMMLRQCSASLTQSQERRIRERLEMRRSAQDVTCRCLRRVVLVFVFFWFWWFGVSVVVVRALC